MRGVSKEGTILGRVSGALVGFGLWRGFLIIAHRQQGPSLTTISCSSYHLLLYSNPVAFLMKRTSAPANAKGSIPPKERVFQIRLRNTGEKVDLSDPGFLRMLEIEYATKYLEQLRIESTSKNIQNILKRNPLAKCHIQESRLAGGLHTDTITIIHRSEADKQIQVDEENNPSDDMIKNMGLKKLRTSMFKQQNIEASQMRRLVVETEPTEESVKEELVKFDFDIERMKNKYLFPFNETFARKNNFMMRDRSEYSQEEEGERLIFESKIFSFPFSEIKVSVTALKELQTPINLTGPQIQSRLEIFCSQFPRAVFPIAPSSIKSRDNQTAPRKHSKQGNLYDSQQVDRVFALLKSQEMSRLIGVLMHFSYWLIFGNVNPINIDSALKKQMYLSMFEILEYFSLSHDNKHTWLTLTMPMILLTLKMMADHLLKEVYPIFFGENSFDINPIGNVATDKLLYLIQNIFDSSNLNGRFVFLESVFNERQSLSHDRKNIRRRIYGTSPMINMIIPHPKDGKSRAIMAKKHQIECRDKIFQAADTRHKSQPLDLLAKLGLDRKKDNQQLERRCQQKMLNVVLSKLQSKLQSKVGPNQIINLGPVAPLSSQ